VASLSQGRTAAAQCGLFTHKSVPVIFEPPCILKILLNAMPYNPQGFFGLLTARVHSSLLFEFWLYLYTVITFQTIP